MRTVAIVVVTFIVATLAGDGGRPAHAGASASSTLAALAKAYASSVKKVAGHERAAAMLARGQRALAAAKKAVASSDDDIVRRMIARARVDLELALELQKLDIARRNNLRMQHRLDDLRVAIKKLRKRVAARQEHIKMIKKMR